MQMNERFYELFTKRQDAAGRVRPGDQEDHFTQNVYPDIKRVLLKTITPDAVKKARMLTELFKRVGLQPAKPFACAAYLKDDLLESGLEAGEQSAKAGNDQQTIFFHDLTVAMAYVTGSIFAAYESLISHGDDTSTLETMTAVEEIYGTKFSWADSAQYYLHLQSFGKRFTEALQEDPTGFSVIDLAIHQLRGLSSQGLSESAGIPQYLNAGAELAGEAYKELYQSLESSQP